MYTISIDPGKKDCGIAYFVDGRLKDCALLAPTPGTPYSVALAASAWASRTGVKVFDLLVVEGQQVYAGPRKQDPNDLIPLAETVGGVMARIQAARTLHPLPREWTKQVPKEVRQRRILGWIKANQPEAFDLIDSVVDKVAKAHNIIDAVHLGYWGLGVV